jgi:hypothetical protein
MVKVDPQTADERPICPYCGAVLAPLDPEEPKRPRYDEPERTGPTPRQRMLLIAAAAAFVVLLAVAGVTAFFLIKKNPPSRDLASKVVDPERETDDRGPAPKTPDISTPKAKDPLAGPFAIRLAPPRKKGDVREVALEGESVSRFTVIEAGNREPRKPLTRKFKLQCKIRTLDVDEAGREKAWEFTVLSLQIPGADKLPPPGTVLKAELPKSDPQGELVFEGRDTGGKPDVVNAVLTRAAGRRLSYWLTDDDDAMFGTPKKEVPDARWGCNEEALNKWYAAGLDPVWDRALAKLNLVKTDGPYLVVEVGLDAKANVKDKTPEGSPTDGKTTNELTGTIHYHLPLKDYQGPSRITSDLTSVTKDEGKPGVDVGSEESLRETFTLDIKYLPSEPVDKPPQEARTRVGAEVMNMAVSCLWPQAGRVQWAKSSVLAI